MDFCYIIKETVQFYLHRRLDIEDPVDDTRTIRGGYVLIFRFVRGDGVHRDWDDIPYPREKPPMGGTPYIGFRPGGGPTFAVSLSHLSAERAPR